MGNIFFIFDPPVLYYQIIGTAAIVVFLLLVIALMVRSSKKTKLSQGTEKSLSRKEEKELQTFISQIQEFVEDRNSSVEVENISKSQKGYGELVKEKVSLGYPVALNYESFIEKADAVLAKKGQILKDYLPLYVINGRDFELFRFSDEQHDELNELLDYWEAGYRNSKLVLLLCLHLFNLKKDRWDTKILQFLTYYDLPREDKKLLAFLFQHLTKETVISLDLTDLPESYRVKQIDISKRFNDKSSCYSIHEMNALISELEGSSIDTKDFCSWYEFLILEKLNPTAKRKSFVKVKLNPFYDSFIESSILKYANYDKVNQQLDPSPHLQELARPGSTELTEDEIRDYLSSRPNYEYHLFYYLFRRNQYLNEKPNIKIAEIDTEQLPLQLRAIAQLYYAMTENYEKAIVLYHSLNHLKTDFIAKLYYARSLFYSGKVSQAWSIIFEAWRSDPKNLLLMNEAAVYSFHSDKMKEAEEIFEKMKKLYPDHPATLHNEAVYFEFKAKKEIKDKWDKYEKMSTSD